MRQTNVLETTPVRDAVTKEIVDDLVIDVKVFDATDTLVPDSDITLPHTVGGVYRGIMPKLEELVNNIKYQLEIDVKSGSVTVYYFKGSIKAIIRDEF
jgi:hypothetical protein